MRGKGIVQSNANVKISDPSLKFQNSNINSNIKIEFNLAHIYHHWKRGE